MLTKTPFRIGSYQINPLENTVVNQEQTNSLQPKFIEVLVFLASQHPNIVTREQIINAVWDGNGYVGEKALTNAIWHLRKTLVDKPNQQEYIETIRKTGYRLMYAPHYQDDETAAPVNLPLAFEWRTKWPSFLALMCVFVSIGLLVGWFSRNESGPTYNEPELLTQYPGRELFPAISNDGRYLLFSWRKMDRNTDLYLQDLTQPNVPPKNLTNSDFVESRAIWSADNKTIYYYRKKQHCQLVAQQLETDEVTVIGQCASAGSGSLTLSDDTKHLFYIGKTENDGASAVYQLDLESKQQKKLTCLTVCDFTDQYITLSPDEESIVVARSLPSGQYQLVLHSLITQQEQILLPWMHTIRGISWHPTLPKLVFASHENGKRLGYEMDVKTGQLTRLPVEGFSYPRYDKNGDIYYHNWQIGTAIMRIELNAQINSAPFPLLQSDYNFRYPNYSAAANKLVVVSNESGNDELWLASLDGTNRTQLTELNAVIRDPVWSHDGRFIVFNVITLTDNILYLLDVATRQLQVLNTQLTYHFKASWSLDDQAIFVGNGDDVYKLTLENQSVVKVTDNGVRYLVESAPNTYIYSKRSKKGLWTKFAGGAERSIFDDVKIPSSTGWQFTEQGIYYFKVLGSDYRLGFYDFSTGQHQDLLRVPERTYSRTRGMAYVPERNWLLFTGYETPQVDIKRLVQK